MEKRAKCGRAVTKIAIYCVVCMYRDRFYSCVSMLQTIYDMIGEVHLSLNREGNKTDMVAQSFSQ